MSAPVTGLDRRHRATLASTSGGPSAVGNRCSGRRATAR
jgi:hypothetical protein